MVLFVLCIGGEEIGEDCTPEALRICNALCARRKEPMCIAERTEAKCTLELTSGESKPCSVEEDNTCKSLQSTLLGCLDESIDCKCTTSALQRRNCIRYESSTYDYCKNQEVNLDVEGGK